MAAFRPSLAVLLSGACCCCSCPVPEFHTMKAYKGRGGKTPQFFNLAVSIQMPP